MKMPNKHSAPRGRSLREPLHFELGGGLETGVSTDAAAAAASSKKIQASYNNAAQTYKEMAGIQNPAVAPAAAPVATPVPGVSPAAGTVGQTLPTAITATPGVAGAAPAGMSDIERRNLETSASSIVDDGSRSTAIKLLSAAPPPMMGGQEMRNMMTSASSIVPDANRTRERGLLAGRSSLRMADGGRLQPHAYGLGGPVEGKDKGYDTIDSKYRPGEYVASKEMLDLDPSLKDHLDGLREVALAQKGMTPEQADSKIVRGDKLRAADGLWAGVKGAYDSVKGAAANTKNAVVGSGANGAKALRSGAVTAGEFAGPAGVIGAAGYEMANAATNQLDSLSDENLDMMTNAGGGDDTALAAAIIQQGRATGAAASPTKTAPTPLDAHDMRPTRGLAGITPGTGDGKMMGAEDKTAQLNSRPDGQLPSLSGMGLRNGAVYKTVDPKTGAVTYSGNNVSTGKDGTTLMVNGKGEFLKNLDGNNSGAGTGYVADAATGKRLGNAFAGGVNVGPGGISGQTVSGTGGKGMPATAEMRGDAVSNALRAAAQAGNFDGIARYYGSKGESFNGKSAELINEEARQSDEAARGPRPGMPGYKEYNDRLAANRHDQTLRRGQDVDLQKAEAPYKAAAKMREVQTELFRRSGGNNLMAAKLAAASGMDPKPFLEAHTAEQGAAKATEDLSATKAKRGRDMFADTYYTTNSKGDTVEDVESRAAAQKAYLNMTSGRNLTEDERVAVEADAKRHGSLVKALRQKAMDANNSWWNYTPFSSAKPLPTDVAPNLRPQEVEGLEGAFTGHGVVKGDHSLGDGYLPADIDEDVLKYQLRRNEAWRAQQAKQPK